MLSVTYVRYSQRRARYLLRDRDGKYGQRYRARARTLGIEEVVIAPRSPSQNPFVERVVGSVRRDCLGYVIVLGDAISGKSFART